MRLVAVAGLIAVVLVGIVVLAGGSNGHDVYVTVPKATGVLKGQKIRTGGAKVGTVTSLEAVQGGRAARLKLTIDDDAWPLTRGSQFLVRWAGTINQYNRYISLTPGPANAPPMAGDGGTIPATALKTPVEYGELLSIFDKPARAGLKDFLDNGGRALDLAGPNLHRSFAAAPPALDQADHVLRDLDASQANLSQLITSTSSVIGAVQRANPGLGAMLQGTGDTLTATALEADNLRLTLQKAPATFTNVRDTLADADPTLAAATSLTRKLGPGVGELRRIAGPLDHLLGTVVAVGPDARATLSTAATSAPDLTRFVNRATDLMPRVKSIATQAAPQIACVTPYAPDIGAFGTDWGSSLASSDQRDKFIRANVEAFLPSLSNNRMDTSADAVKANPGLRYAFPRPPGYMAGQTYFLPKCNIGPESLDAAQDPEAKPYSSISQLPELAGGEP